jgi:hypothetical protein
MQIWSDEDDNAGPEPRPALVPSCGASLGVWKDVLSDPTSFLWKGRGNVNVAVVLFQQSSKVKERLDKGSSLHALSASEENIMVGKKDHASKRISTSRDWKESGLWHRGGGFKIPHSFAVCCLCLLAQPVPGSDQQFFFKLCHRALSY